MPCNSDHMRADSYERELSQVACFLDELRGKKWTQSELEGYHPGVYCRNIDRATGDAMVRKLCETLQSRDVSTCSLELQMWWRDHKRADAERVQREIDDAKTQKARAAAIAKLTPHERKLLNLYT